MTKRDLFAKMKQDFLEKKYASCYDSMLELETALMQSNEENRIKELEAQVAQLEEEVRERPRMAKRGSGAHYIIKRLTWEHQAALQVLWIGGRVVPGSEQKGSWDYDSGLTTKEIASFVPDWVPSGESWPDAHGLGGRLSEMQNPHVGLVTSAYNELRKKDVANSQWRSEKNRWWLPSNLRTAQLEDILNWSIDASSVPVP